MNEPHSFGILGPDEFRKIREVFESAIELTPAERERFINQSCGGDRRLIAEVQRMLSGDAEGNALLDSGTAVGLHEGAVFGGHFRFGALLGRGGMGEVYRAHDVQLHRDVALKMLPRSFAFARDRVERFKREAQVLASLNHPNIAGIHGLEESDGVYALVLELVEGPTLADRLAGGPIRMEEALSIARQIAVALQAAHERGIVHRDLKPANLKAPDEGPLKVLDFGLAKLNDEPGATDSSSASSKLPTNAPSPAMSADGGILGTAAYMSPEQALGKGVDKRTDIWAFGACFSKCSRGRAPLPGQTSRIPSRTFCKASPASRTCRPQSHPRYGHCCSGAWRRIERGALRMRPHWSTCLTRRPHSLRPFLCASEIDDGCSPLWRQQSSLVACYGAAGLHLRMGAHYAVCALQVRWPVDDQGADPYCGVAGWFATGLPQQWPGVPS